jgi:hypothetical protein
MQQRARRSTQPLDHQEKSALVGIDAQIEDEAGKQIQFCHDVSGAFARLLASSDLSSSVCLRFIDPYGDTIFNRVQAVVLLKELGLVRAAADSTAGAYIDKVLRFANTAARDPHHYVRFIGD